MVLERWTVNKELRSVIGKYGGRIWRSKFSTALGDHDASIWQDDLYLRIELRHWHWSQNGPHFYFLNALMFPLDILAKQIGLLVWLFICWQDLSSPD